MTELWGMLVGRVRVAGENKEHDVVVYSLSSCIPCKKAMGLLESMGVEYEYIHLDTVDPEERSEAMVEIGELLPGRGIQLAYPIIVIDDLISIIGFSERKLRKLFEEKL
jgi:glutaredoxin-like protein NrdH